MHHTDLPYRREMFGWSRRQFARRLGRSYQTVMNWETGITEMPPWLGDWLEHMDWEIRCYREPGPIPKRFVDIEAILYPTRVSARKAAKRPRRPNGVHTIAQDAKAARREQRRQNKVKAGIELAARRQLREAKRNLLARAAASRAARRNITKT